MHRRRSGAISESAKGEVIWRDGVVRTPNEAAPAEVAALFRVEPKTVTRWANVGNLPSIRTLGGDRRNPEAEVMALREHLAAQPRDHAVLSAVVLWWRPRGWWDGAIAGAPVSGDDLPGVGPMTTQTPIQPTSPWTTPTSDADAAFGATPPPPAAKRGWPVWAWLLLGLAVLLAAGAVVAVAVAGEEDTAVVNTHTAEAGEPALISVPGYAYEDLTGHDPAAVESGFASSNEEMQRVFPDAGDLWLGWSGHSVVAADGEVGRLLLGSVNEEFLQAGLLTEEDLVFGMAGAAAATGSTVTTETIAGENVVYDVDDGIHGFSWFDAGVMTMVSGWDEGDLRDFVEAYLETAHEFAEQT